MCWPSLHCLAFSVDVNYALLLLTFDNVLLCESCSQRTISSCDIKAATKSRSNPNWHARRKDNPRAGDQQSAIAVASSRHKRLHNASLCERDNAVR
mmetsp:Transcript_12962/g.27534  ORF Transcript_12962/g.27534 Transcript_12962/m.27534 type:complete len:96 (+) Transcript_12962:1256-1543(+)